MLASVIGFPVAATISWGLELRVTTTPNTTAPARHTTQTANTTTITTRRLRPLEKESHAATSPFFVERTIAIIHDSFARDNGLNTYVPPVKTPILARDN